MTPDVLGKGLYTYPEAAHLAELSPQRVRAWFNTPNGEKKSRRKVLHGDYSGERIISFLDLIEVVVAGQLRGLGISLQLLRKARASLKTYLQTEHPFSHKSLKTDGSALFIHLKESADAEDELINVVSHQLAIPKVLMPYLKNVGYDSHSKLAADWKIAKHVIIDPTRSFGKPIVQTCAIPTSVLTAAYYANHQDADAVANWYGVTPEDIQAAVNFEKRYFGRAA